MQSSTAQVSLGKQLFYQALLILISIAVLYPILWVLKMALTPSQAFSMDPWPIPSQISFENFIAVVSTSDSTGNWLFGQQLFNSIIIAAITSVLGIALSCTAGYAMSRFTFPGREMGMNLFLITQMFPGVVMAIPLYILMDELGLLNSIWGLSLAYASTAIPFCTWNLKGYFDTIPSELEEAARMDGASQWVIFTQIVLPLSKPALAVTGLFSFMTAWNEFILAATFLSDESAFTLPVLLQSYVGDFGTEWGKFAAGAIIASAPVMLLFFMLQKNLVEGLTAGSVKG
ncbi:MAG: ABC transporter [Proteobacteria bacterium]|nr:ABC transporter [Pseudomonadota bacterium]